METLVGLVTLVAMIALTWKTAEDAISKTVLREIRDSGEGVITVWPARWLPPVGCAMMAGIVAIRLLSDVRTAFGADRGDTENF